jgi:hypothetical protein
MRQSPLLSPRGASSCPGPPRPGHDSMGVCAKRRSSLRGRSHSRQRPGVRHFVADDQNGRFALSRKREQMKWGVAVISDREVGQLLRNCARTL